MRLHIVPDEKIINRCINSFETVYPGDNKYIVITRTPKEHRYVTERTGVLFLKYNTPEFWNQVGDLSEYASIIVHFLKGDSLEFLLKISHPCIYWIEWGADLYRSMLSPKGYQLYADKDILWKIDDRFKFKILFKLNEYLAGKKSQFKMIRAVKKVKYFVPDSMYDEYPLLLKYFPQLNHLEYRDFFYYPIDEILGDKLINARVSGDNIIIGNSASISNNHLYVFEKLHTLGNLDKNIIVPLSYGIKEKYVNMVNDAGETFWGKRYQPVRNFMSLEEYNNLLLSANIFIYGNWRQEAVGNILIALYLGGKVFLDEHNPLLNFYKSLGLSIWGINEFSKEELCKRMSINDVKKNQDILLSVYSRKRQLELIKKNF